VRQNADDHLASETIFSTRDLGGLSVALVKGTKKINFLFFKQHSKSHSYVLSREHVIIRIRVFKVIFGSGQSH
jgi:hypothetical protein